jgi:hypothetical protein
MKLIFFLKQIFSSVQGLKGLQKFIPYPPQPYLLTCPQVLEIKICKTFEAVNETRR